MTNLSSLPSCAGTVSEIQNLPEIPRGCPMSSVHKRSEVPPKNPSFTETWREAPAERLTSKLMISFRVKRRVCEQKTWDNPAEFLNTPIIISLTVPSTGPAREEKFATPPASFVLPPLAFWGLL